MLFEEAKVSWFEDYMVLYIEDPFKKIHKKTSRVDKHFQQSNRIQN